MPTEPNQPARHPAWSFAGSLPMRRSRLLFFGFFFLFLAFLLVPLGLPILLILTRSIVQPSASVAASRLSWSRRRSGLFVKLVSHRWRRFLLVFLFFFFSFVFGCFFLTATTQRTYTHTLLRKKNAHTTPPPWSAAAGSAFLGLNRPSRSSTRLFPFQNGGPPARVVGRRPALCVCTRKTAKRKNK